MTEPFSIVSASWIKPLYAKLGRLRGERKDEIASLGNIFGDPVSLARYYIQPKCQHHNPADHHEDEEAMSTVRSPIFDTINHFIDKDLLIKGGHNQLFILADAGMGKTSLLVMLKLMHILRFWPKEYECVLLKLEQNTLPTIEQIKTKHRTVLLLDALDEDPEAWGNIEKRLIKLITATTNFHRVLITCRTQFFPEHGADPFHRTGCVELGGFICPMIYLSLFDDIQVDEYLDRRFPRRWLQVISGHRNKTRLAAKDTVLSMKSLRFRPLLLACIEDVMLSHKDEWNEYELFEALVRAWLGRESQKLHALLGFAPSVDDLLKSCSWVATYMQARGAWDIKSSTLELLQDTHPDIAHFDKIDIRGRSLLNRNSAGAFRFSHYTIQEFLVVHGLATKTTILEKPIRVTSAIVDFMTMASIPGNCLRMLDVSGLNRKEITRGIKFEDSIQLTNTAPLMTIVPAGSMNKVFAETNAPVYSTQEADGIELDVEGVVQETDDISRSDTKLVFDQFAIGYWCWSESEYQLVIERMRSPDEQSGPKQEDFSGDFDWGYRRKGGERRISSTDESWKGQRLNDRRKESKVIEKEMVSWLASETGERYWLASPDELTYSTYLEIVKRQDPVMSPELHIDEEIRGCWVCRYIEFFDPGAKQAVRSEHKEGKHPEEVQPVVLDNNSNSILSVGRRLWRRIKRPRT